MSCARNAISKINEPLKPVLSPLNFYCALLPGGGEFSYH